MKTRGTEGEHKITVGNLDAKLVDATRMVLKNYMTSL